MPSLVFNNCCGCIALRTGCFIIAYLELVTYVIITVLSIMGVIGGAVVSTEEKDEDVKTLGMAISIVSGITLFYILFWLAFVITLLVGLHKSKRGPIKVYLIASTIFVVIDIIMFFVSFMNPASATTIISRILSILLEVYAIAVIRSYYYKLESNKGSAYNTA